MPLDTAVVNKQWNRYVWIRDNGHLKYVEKHDKCERFFAGDQWNKVDKQTLTAIRRPALTINKIISTMSNVMGEQIYNRSEISFRPRGGANEQTADILTKVFKQISDQNQLDWKRSDMFADGIIGGRGFLDVRMSFKESMQGDVVIDNLNPKDVLIDPDADQFDPDTWNEVYITRWLTADDIAILYSKADARLLRGKSESSFPFGYDSIDRLRDRFGNSDMYYSAQFGTEGYDQDTNRCIRVVERQYRKMDRQMHFVYPKTGETRPIPTAWDEDRVQYVAREFGLETMKKLVRRIRWCVTADNVKLHDDWSPYKHFTPVPYFPYFRRGVTIGLVENLLDPQDLLNKSSSQELHVVNTTANSGWKYRANSLVNITAEELEERGAETGLVVATVGDPDKDLVKITPNQVPQGLDRVSYKAEDHIKSISGVNDSMQGFAREDVAAKAIGAQKKSGQTNLVKPLDSLTRTDYLIARNTLDLVQEFYSEERVMTFTKDTITGETEDFKINEMTPEGKVLNDLMIGEFGIVVSSVPQRETLEDNEFDQLVAMRKDIGVKIPDRVIINASRLRNKAEVIKLMEGDKESPEGRKQAELAARAAEATVSKEEGEAKAKHEDAGLRNAKAKQIAVEANIALNTPPESGDTPGLDVDVAAADAQRADAESSAKIEAIQKKSDLEREKAVSDAQLKAQMAAQKAADDRVARMTQPRGE